MFLKLRQNLIWIHLRNNARPLNTTKWVFSKEDVASKVDEALVYKEPRLINKKLVFDKENVEKQSRLRNCKIFVEGYTPLTNVNEIPSSIRETRRVRIHQPSKNAMQSGTHNTGYWMIDFDKKECWDNPCMGWRSSGDPVQGLRIKFSSKEKAVTYCEKNGWDWWVQETWKEKPFKPKSYGDNFSWNKKTRVSTK